MVSLCAGLLYCSSAFADNVAPKDPATFFAAFSRGEFADFGPPEYLDLEDGRRLALPRISFGPMVAVGEAKEVQYAVIKRQAEVVSKAGPAAFDVAFQHLDDDRLYMRWIAVESLFMITGKRPPWYFHAKPGEEWNSDKEWTAKAKAVWQQWKAEQAVAH